MNKEKLSGVFVRIVKMGFHENHVKTFLFHFNTNKQKIRGFQGCRFLELYQDKKDPTIFFTYSYWDSEAHLERYRQSELFRSVWSKTKPLFNRPPEAWSVDKIESLE
ncbi:antibiotic biosynthesis monooxygenase family protein [Tamlana sp. 2201CG12-4]|uniref:putative quinol monooxygenase n=1 Tax=Tamlana sp. 2201CG12-4 TaxID=3112582 RepID=UPI002DBAE9E4|nr:antibiotic biosynthesis monooxygenase family protein [Tamlana sp. 2201CG12-4]MEC3908543.1 antibiotic biosynthesis monooxygenase family protein [Tamlana sp. 2201CG12-4]